MIVEGLWTDIVRSIGFLSRLPISDSHFAGHDGSMSRMVRAFPVAGFLIALPAAAIFSLVLAVGHQPLLAAFLALGVQALVTGALHEDGLCDTVDGLGGGKDRERALEIMRDSRIGAFGAVVLIVTFGIRASALAAIGMLLSPSAAGFALAAIGALSRAALVWHWSQLPPARRDGVAASSGMPDGQSVTMALGLGALAVIVFIWPWSGLLPVLVTLIASGIATWSFTRHIGRRLGGHTGDTIGAAQQISEIAALAALAVFL